MGGMLSRLRGGGGRGGGEHERCTVSASIRYEQRKFFFLCRLILSSCLSAVDLTFFLLNKTKQKTSHPPSRHYGLKAMDPADANAARGGRGDDDNDQDDKDDPLWLVVGLGNPGPRYDGTRHNIGFAAVDRLARLEGIDVGKVQCNAAVGRGRISGNGGGGGNGTSSTSARVLLAKPLTFMNVSGESVGKLAKFYRVPPSRVLVLYDDLDTAVGVTRLRSKGGHGGHNGMRSIMSHLANTKDFPRVRLGIGRPPGTMPVAAYVLQSFSKEEKDAVEASIEEACEAVKQAVTMGIEKAVSQRPSRGERFVEKK